MENSVNNCNYFISSKYAEDDRVMHSKSDNIKFTFYSNANEVDDHEFFESLRSRYQDNLAKLRKWSKCILNVFCHKCHKVSFWRCGSYNGSPEWIKKKKTTTINQENKDNKWFQFALTVALNYEELKCNPGRVSKSKLVINTYKWKEINYQK